MHTYYFLPLCSLGDWKLHVSAVIFDMMYCLSALVIATGTAKNILAAYVCTCLVLYVTMFYHSIAFGRDPTSYLWTLQVIFVPVLSPVASSILCRFCFTGTVSEYPYDVEDFWDLPKLRSRDQSVRQFGELEKGLHLAAR
ncbi:hypothetical protein V5O48_001073 [Marasmius crinis-equi]|uniref:Uncharacterized protein n=1 Tax=Marasmius crinis-equi TaxID=585013 RepID=A0ABR3FZJ5_9AGAR